MDTIIYNVDSRNRNKNLYPYETDFTVSFNDNIKNIISIQLSSLEFGNTSYVFSSAKGSNSFDIYTGNDKVTITVPDGNYNSDEIISTINELIEAESIATIEFSINNNTGKVTITITATHTFDFSNTTDYKSLGEILGFEDSIFEIEKEDDESYNTKVSTNMLNVIGEHYYFLKLNDIGKVYNNSKKYFSKLIINAPKYEAVYETRNRYVTKKVDFQQPINLQKMEVQVVDKFDNIVMQNGIHHFSFTLEFEVIRNDTLKRYKSLPFFSKDLMKIMLYDKMLEYYNNKLKNDPNNRGLQITYQKLLSKHVTF